MHIAGRINQLNLLIQADVSNLNNPTKFSNSTILQDISLITGTEYVGSVASADSMVLAQRYTVSLLTTCAHRTDGDVDCTQPALSYRFNPGSDLKLQGTSIPSPLTSQELDSYQSVSYFLSVAYSASACSLALSAVLNLASACFPRSSVSWWWSQGFNVVGTLLLFTASAAAAAEFTRLRSQFNSAFTDAGIETTVGVRVYVVSFLGSTFGAAATVCLALRGRYRSAAASTLVFDMVSGTKGTVVVGGRRNWGRAGGGGGDDVPNNTNYDNNEDEDDDFRPSFVRRVTTWNLHKYAQVRKQKPVIVNQDRAAMFDADSWQGLVAAVEEDEFPYERPDDIAMGDVGLLRRVTGL
ncbi:hypothetical protein BX600DRAFT_12274 [Xylariales sp. PMI_506]|nr:hypothetical protein BX600DRAFT_12274 [Xylariales sp. PMI_506]